MRWSVLCPMVVAMALSPASVVLAEQSAPWGKAQAMKIEYAPQKVVYDVSVRDDDKDEGEKNKKDREVRSDNKDEKDNKNENNQRVKEVNNVEAVMDALENVLDRVSFLNNLYQANPFDASIVVVMHGDEIPMFAIENYGKYKDLMVRAQSLTVGGTIEFRMCEVAAKNHGLEPQEIHGFVEVVPMADAEIIRLQGEENYAYMQ